jgi:hypothetical protein
MYNRNRIAVIVVLLLCTFGAGMFYNHAPWEDGRQNIIKMVMRYPNVFNFGEGRRNFMVKTLKKCKGMNERNWDKFVPGESDDYFIPGDSYESVQEACIDKVIKIIQNGAVAGIIKGSTKGVIQAQIGGLSNNIRLKAYGVDKFTLEQDKTYKRNLKKIMDAIPSNIPDMKTLSSVPISNVVFYKDFAKIKWMKDHDIEELEGANIPYKGQF